MKKISLNIQVFAILIFVLSSCIAVKFRSEKEIFGIEDNLCQSAKDSITKANIILIHGIGRTKFDYSEKMIHNISKNILGKNYCENKCTIGQFDGKLIKYRNVTHKNAKNQRELVFYSIWWSPLTEPIKDSIILTERNHNPKSRRFALLPYMLKTKVMTDRAGDAFFVQQKDVMESIIQMLDTIVVDIQKQEDKLSSLNLISASLGSQVFTKYLITNYERSWKESAIENGDKTNIENFTDLFLTTKHKDSRMSLNFYLLSNQLMLMNESVISWGGCDPIVDSSQIEAMSFSNMNYYAFRNPNDFLNYYLDSNAITKQFKAVSINVVNSWYYNLALRPGAVLTRNGSIKSHVLPYKLNKISSIISYGTYKNDSGK